MDSNPICIRSNDHAIRQFARCRSTHLSTFLALKTLFGALALFLLVIVSPPLFANDKPLLKAITVDDNFPYNFLKNNQIQGIGYEVAEQLAERAGMRLETEVVPWSRALITARNQANVLLFSVARITERENDFYWIGPIVKAEDWLYRLAARSELTVKTLEEVKRYKIGDVAHNSIVPYLKSLGINVDTAPDNRSNCRKLKYGRVDFIALNPEGLQAFIGLCDLNPIQLEKVLFLRSSDLYIAFSKLTDPILVSLLTEHFSKMIKDKSLEKITAKWLNKSAPHLPAYKN